MMPKLPKFEDWDGKPLIGMWRVTLKLDGIQAIWTGSKWVSRLNANLYNLPTPDNPEPRVYEFFYKNWQESLSRCRTIVGQPIPAECLYCLNPLDKRLDQGFVINFAPSDVKKLLEEVNKYKEYDGLVFRKSGRWIKAKPTETHDVRVTGVVRGTGKYKNMMGALETEKGKVGMGFTDMQRAWWWEHKDLDPLPIIEVECNGLTHTGQFRFGRFKRVRLDKSV